MLLNVAKALMFPLGRVESYRYFGWRFPSKLRGWELSHAPTVMQFFATARPPI
jgi:hypothetical protein